VTTPLTTPPALLAPSVVVRALLAALLATSALLLGVVAPGTPASAHDSLAGSSPADGATVDVAPASVDLSFTQPPLAIGSQVQVTGPDGGVVNAGDLVLSDTTASQPLAPDLPAGAYRVAWRVTSSDGHPISGELSFTVAGTAAPADPTPTPDPGTPTQEPGQTPAPTATATAGPGAADAGDPGTGTGAAQEAGVGALPWLVAVAVIALAAAGLWWSRRRAGAGDA
jgi:hypothetical protein